MVLIETYLKRVLSTDFIGLLTIPFVTVGRFFNKIKLFPAHFLYPDIPVQYRWHLLSHRSKQL